LTVKPAELGAIALEQESIMRTTGEGVRKLIAPVGFIVGLGLLWEAASWLGLLNEIIVPPPSAVAGAFGNLLFSDYLGRHFSATLLVTLVGFVAGGGGAFALGAAMVMYSRVRRAVYPSALILQTMPRVALAPVFITWFGFGFAPKIVMAATICFFPVLINTIVGMTDVEEEALLLIRSHRGTRWQEFVELRLPNAAPAIFAGLKAAITFSLVGAVVVELVGAKEGLGVLIERFSFSLQIPLVFATIFLLAVMGMILYGLMEVIDRRVVFWVERSSVAATTKVRGKPRGSLPDRASGTAH
jgi:NitT/TauT family transport system permease protein